MSLLRQAARGGLTILGICGLGLGQPAGLAAQEQNKTWHIGLCHVGLDHEPPSLATLHQTLNEMGYEDEKDLVFDWRNQADAAGAEAVAKEWVADGVDLIVAFEDQCVRAAKAATSDIPIVFVHAFDPAAAGYIQSLARPGGNITGPASYFNLIGKRLEALKELDPQLQRVLVLFDGNDPFTPRQLETAREAASALQLELVEKNAATAADLERVFGELEPGEVGGVVVASPDLVTNHTNDILDLAAKAALPVAAHRKGWVERGALLSYAPDYAAAGPVAARYVDRIFKGTDPGELPVEELSEIVLTLNVKRAQELGLSVPPAILLRADQIIE